MTADIVVDINDSEVIDAFRTDNKSVMHRFYKMHYPMVSHFVIYNGGTDQEAKDIYQEAIIAIYEKINERSLILNCRLKTYLYSVCRNLWLKQISKKGKFAGRIEDMEEYLPVEEENGMEAEKNHHFQIMGDAMNQVGEPCYTLLNDFYIHKMSMNAIAEKFAYTNADTAKTQRYKCMNRLKKIFFDIKNSKKLQ